MEALAPNGRRSSRIPDHELDRMTTASNRVLQRGQVRLTISLISQRAIGAHTGINKARIEKM